MSKQYERRINELVRKIVCDLIEREINDPRVSGVTILDVAVSQDTRHAVVRYSVIGDDEKKAEVLQGLRSATGWVNREVAKRLRTRHTPHVHFRYDQGLEFDDRMSVLLEQIKAEEETRPKPEP